MSKPLIASLACSLACKGELSRTVAPFISAEVVQPFVFSFHFYSLVFKFCNLCLVA